MRAISFSATIPQIQNRTKTVTRRLGWKTLTPGQELRGVEKAMGLKKGEKHKTLAIIKVTDVRQEPLNACTDEDAAAEGFPEMTGAEFVAFFCKAMRCTPDETVTRIEFKYLEHCDLCAFAGTPDRLTNCMRCGETLRWAMCEDCYVFAKHNTSCWSCRTLVKEES